MKKYVTLPVLIIIILVQQLSALNIIIENINEKYGLPKNRVNCMFQDSIGFLWFGMANGLYKFDLNAFTKYDLEKNNFILSIDLIWLSGLLKKYARSSE